MEHLFIVNPVAGKGRAIRVIEKAKRILSGKLKDFVIKYTDCPNHATDIAREHAEKGASRIYSVGGDGTLNEVLNGMIGTKSSLGIIPAGSGNDFSRTIYPDAKLSHLNTFITDVMNGTSKPVDAAMLNGRSFLNVASIGFDAEVAFSANSLKKNKLVPRNLAYYLALLGTLGKCQSHKMKVNIDGEYIEDEFLLITVANGRYYGKGLLAAPYAKVDDGLLDVCMIRKKSRLEILRLFPKYAAGKHESIPGVTFHKAKKAHIVCEAPVAVNLDGEVNRYSEAAFETIPQGVNILMP